jgi:hypothetical protein
VETQADKLNRLSAIIALIAKIFASKPGDRSENVQLLQMSQAAFALQKGLNFNEAWTMYNDVIFLAVQIYKDRPMDGLSPDEQELVTSLLKEGFLTRDPDAVSPTAG